ncbi:YqaA family protein [Pragia fontium]|uniref:Membrane protein YqaA, SNARE-associated domain n=1 Tax=Pragia fontium DSM 5563 = ATCC 49100 TaxID=1122977 RepID=A0AAJ4WBI5_9GAMM|nr:YqaA family protein [Pragia fontium]SFD03663.1 membrane protein YqaA, SNARE-associated domain [Pragia fontium DSM 5563 = ATCC 49100]SUB83254.1 Inner membrane protein yqaA [Pragia fontium]VEJ56149.1 Inner membrane protein yqaA [Pragia fontium]
MSDTLPLLGLFSSSFLSATLLPGNSEVVFAALLTTVETDPLLLLAVAIVGNTLGGLTNVVIGRLAPIPKHHPRLALAMKWLQRFGAPALLLSWLPIMGDLLCLLAGWLRLPWWSVTFFMLIGKSLRYIAVMLITLKGLSFFS